MTRDKRTIRINEAVHCHEECFDVNVMVRSRPGLTHRQSAFAGHVAEVALSDRGLVGAIPSETLDPSERIAPPSRSVLHGRQRYRRRYLFRPCDFPVMSHEADAGRRHHIPGSKRRVRNWTDTTSMQHAVLCPNRGRRRGDVPQSKKSPANPEQMHSRSGDGRDEEAHVVVMAGAVCSVAAWARSRCRAAIAGGSAANGGSGSIGRRLH